MIQKMSHVPIWVLDQDSAKAFYVETLGFDLRNDHDMGNGFRWITVSPPGQADFEITLMSTLPNPMLDESTAAAIRQLVKDGKLGAGVFATSDCFKTCEELKAKGVRFLKEPTKEFYGIEAIMLDDSGNWFSLTQES
jgi:catechol 2,3-dioxygenase-like lactoylglutathione lyase family enzyme